MSELTPVDDDEINCNLMASSAITFSRCALLCHNNGGLERKRRRFMRVRGYLKSRTKYGAYNCLMRDIKFTHEDKLKYYIQMDLSTFEELFSLMA